MIVAFLPQGPGISWALWLVLMIPITVAAFVSWIAYRLNRESIWVLAPVWSAALIILTGVFLWELR